MESAPARRDCQAIILIKLFCTKKGGVKQKSAGRAMPRNRTESGEFRRVFSAGSIMRAAGGCLLGEHRAARLRAGCVFRRDFGADASERDAGAEVLCRENGAWERGKGGKGRIGLPSREKTDAWLTRSFAALFFPRRHGGAASKPRGSGMMPSCRNLFHVPHSAAERERRGREPPAARREKEARSGRIAAAKKTPSGPLVRPENGGTRCIFSCFFGREAEKWIDRKHGQ